MKPRPVTQPLAERAGFRGMELDIRLDGDLVTTARVEEVTKIGRLRSSHIYLDNVNVARMHAVVERDPQGPRLVDLGSPAGTTINGERVDRNAPLKEGDVIGIGPYELTLVCPEEPEEEEPKPEEPEEEEPKPEEPETSPTAVEILKGLQDALGGQVELQAKANAWDRLVEFVDSDLPKTNEAFQALIWGIRQGLEDVRKIKESI